jgi:hypothetical protein
MPFCPHCGQEIETTPAANIPWWKLDLTRHGVNLGCGSLILIAIIVAVCSGGGRLSTKLGSLDADIQKLDQKIDELGKAVDKLSNKP